MVFPNITQDVEDQRLGLGALAFPLTLLFEQASLGVDLTLSGVWNNFLLHRSYQQGA